MSNPWNINRNVTSERVQERIGTKYKRLKIKKASRFLSADPVQRRRIERKYRNDPVMLKKVLEQKVSIYSKAELKHLKRLTVGNRLQEFKANAAKAGGTPARDIVTPVPAGQPVPHGAVLPSQTLRHDVDSSNVTSIGYDEIDKIIVVEFHGGGKPQRIYFYFDTTPADFDDLVVSGSKGRYCKIEMTRLFSYLRVQ